jgi:hypothetical protein
VEKKLVCLYQHDQTVSAAVTRKDRSKPTQQWVPTTPLPSDGSRSSDLTSDGSLLQFYEESPASGLEGLGIATSYQLASLQSPLFSDNLSTSDHAHSKGHASSTLMSHKESLLPESFLFNEPRWSLDLSNVSLLVHEPVPRAPRAFFPKRQRYRQLSLTRKYVICTLNTYPQMLLSSKELPPFVHTQLQSSSTDVRLNVSRTSSIDPWATCVGITAMWSVKNRHNTTFIWRSIRSEQERLYEEVRFQHLIY